MSVPYTTIRPKHRNQIAATNNCQTEHKHLYLQQHEHKRGGKQPRRVARAPETEALCSADTANQRRGQRLRQLQSQTIKIK